MIDRLIELGYEVSTTQVGDGFRILYVSGHGLANYVRDDDHDAIRELAESHAERVTQYGESPFQTMLRWHDDPDHDLQLDADALEVVRRLADPGGQG